jgi:ABC-type molybdenum transport system ATPase subunit/photorepair protein PhrA
MDWRRWVSATSRSGNSRGLRAAPTGRVPYRAARNKPLNQSAPIVDIRNLDYSVTGRPVFAGLDIQIPRGKITAVMGPSGTGKTTLLRLITGQVLADSGTIDVAGRIMRTIGARICMCCADAWACCSRTARC